MTAALILLRKFWFAIPIVLLFAALMLTRHTLANEKEGRLAERKVHEQFVADVKAKTELARISDAAHKAQVERDQTQVTQEVSSDYQTKLADLRRRYDALRLQRASTANSSGSRSSTVPGVPNATGPVDGATSEGGLSAPDALIASEQALRLQALQDWVRGQVAVDR